MPFPGEDDPEPTDAVRRYVTVTTGRSRRYMKLPGGKFARPDQPDRGVFLRGLVADACEITNLELGALLDAEWRARITAAWFIGISRRHLFRERLGAMLLDSEVCYAGQGYCFALARLGTARDAEILAAYLDRYLPRDDCHYDQPWALGALLHIDERLRTTHADRFLAPGGLWHQWSRGRFDAASQKERVAHLSAYVDRGTGLP